VKKECSKCHKIKPIDEFYNSKTCHDGKRTKCKVCFSADVQAHSKRPEIKAARNAQRRKYRKQPHIEEARQARRNTPEAKAKAKANAQLPEVKVARNARERQRRKDDLRFHLNQRMSCAISQSLEGGKGGRPWEALVGFSLSDLMWHLEKQFTDGMSWENRSEWHIDHIIPKSRFNFEKATDLDFKRCWALKNLQPLWGPENIKKGNKTDTPHQPSLLLSV